MANLSISELFPSAFLNDQSSLHQTLGEEFCLCDNGNMAFHWADFDETCEAIKAKLEKSQELKDDFRKKEFGLNRLALIPVWIKTQRKVHQTTMFQLYEKYIMNQTHLALGVDPFGPIEISFISSTGPFRNLAIAECFNRSTYKDFVMMYLLKDKLPKRDFRVRLKAKVLLEYGPEFSMANLVHLEQLTMTGLLLSVDSEFFMKEISKEGSVRILLDTSVLAQGLKKDLNELKGHLSQFAFNLMYSSRKEDSITCNHSDFVIQSSFDFLKNRKVYLFITYDKFESARKETLKNIKEFVSHTRELIRDYYQSGEDKNQESA